MIKGKKLRLILAAIILALFLLISVAHADEPYDITMCMSGQTSNLLTSKELVVFNYQGDGMTISNHANKIFHGMSYRCFGTSKIVKGILYQVGFCKYMDADGDIIVGEGTRIGQDGQWKFLHGTGKWQGITGGGPIAVPIARGKPISEGTFQICHRAKGTFKLP